MKKGGIKPPQLQKLAYHLTIKAPRQGTKIGYLLELDKKIPPFFVCYI